MRTGHTDIDDLIESYEVVTKELVSKVTELVRVKDMLEARLDELRMAQRGTVITKVAHAESTDRIEVPVVPAAISTDSIADSTATGLSIGPVTQEKKKKKPYKPPPQIELKCSTNGCETRILRSKYANPDKVLCEYCCKIKRSDAMRKIGHEHGGNKRWPAKTNTSLDTTPDPTTLAVVGPMLIRQS